MKTKQCVDCRDGEHDNYDDDVKLTVLRDEYKIIKRAYMCDAHRESYACDGYDIYVNGKRINILEKIEWPEEQKTDAQIQEERELDEDDGIFPL